MHRMKRGARFLMGLLLNLLLNAQWSIPAWILLALHFRLNLSLWWFAGALGFWILRVLAGRWLMGWAVACGKQKDPPKENKNPYSKTNFKIKE